MSEINKEILAYYAGTKVGIETMIQMVDDVAKINDGEFSVEAFNILAKNMVKDIERNIKSMPYGEEFLEVFNKNSIEIAKTKGNINEIISDEGDKTSE